MRTIEWIAVVAVVLGGCDRVSYQDTPVPGPCEQLRLRRPVDEPACVDLARATALAQVGRLDEALALAVSVEASVDGQPGVAALAALSQARWHTDSEAREQAHARAYESAVRAGEARIATVVAADAVMAAGDVLHVEAQAWAERMETSIDRPPTDPGVASAVASARGRMAVEQGRAEDALGYFGEAIEHQRLRWGTRSPQVARGLGNLGRAQRRAGQTEEARASYEQALEIIQAQPWIDPSQLADAYEHRGSLHTQEQEIDEALADFRRALALRRDYLGSVHPDVAQTQLNIAVTLGRAKRHPQALETFGRALDGFTAALGADHPMVAAVLINRGASLAALGMLDEAADDYLVALAIIEAGERQGSREHVAVLVNLAAARMRQERFDNAVEELKHALTVVERAGNADTLAAAVLHINACEAHRALGEIDVARPHCERAVEIRESHLQADHPSVKRARDSLAKLRAGDPP